MSFLKILHLFLSILSTIIAFFSSVLNGLNHLIMSLSAFIELRLKLLILDFFEFKLLLEDCKFFLKHILEILQFFFFFFNWSFKLFLSLSGKFFSILKLELKPFNFSSTLRLQFIHGLLHLIILALTHGHVILEISLTILPFLSFKVILLLDLFKGRLNFKKLFSGLFQFKVERFDLLFILRLNVSSPLLMVFLFSL